MLAPRLLASSWILASLALIGAAGPAVGDEAVEPRATLRVVFAARRSRPRLVPPGLNPLLYPGGFHTKTCVYEPLVSYARDGSIAPCLAESWTMSEDGLRWTFVLRAGVSDHTGAALRASDVRNHIRRVAANPGNFWIGGTERIRDVRCPNERTVEITLHAPWFLPGELVCVNPWHIAPDAAFDYEGVFWKTVGTGPFRLVDETPDLSQTYVAHDTWWGGQIGIGRIEARMVPGAWSEGSESLQALLSGQTDLVLDGEAPAISREELARVAGKGRFKIWQGPGSSVHYLRLNTRRGALAQRDARRRLARGVDRAQLIEVGELGYADPVTTMFRPGFAGWPLRGAAAAPVVGPGSKQTPVTLLLRAGVSPRLERHASLLVTQLAREGFQLQIDEALDANAYAGRVAAGEYDLLIETTHGCPYDPWISLQILFANDASRAQRTAARAPPIWEDERMRTLVLRAEGALDERERRNYLGQCQDLLDEEVPVVPLFMNHRIAVSVAELEGLEFGINAYDASLERVRFAGRRAAPRDQR